MKSAAAVTSASEKAICTTTSGLRGRNFQRGRLTSSPACCFKSPMTAARESFSAGPSAKQSVPSDAEHKRRAEDGRIGAAHPDDIDRHDSA